MTTADAPTFVALAFTDTPDSYDIADLGDVRVAPYPGATTYRADRVVKVADGSLAVHLVRQTKTGRDFKTGMGTWEALTFLLADRQPAPVRALGHAIAVAVVNAERTLTHIRETADQHAAEQFGAPVTVPMPQAGEGECPDCLAPEGECSAATCPAYASDDAPDTGALAPDAPLGTIRFHEGSEDAPQCPCGNDVQAEGFRHVTVAATADDGWVGVFIEPDGAWHALGRHVACLRDYCLRVWSDREIVRDGTGTWAPVTMRLHHVAEPVQS